MQDSGSSFAAEILWTSQVVPIEVMCSAAGVSSVRFISRPRAAEATAGEHPSPLLAEACSELLAYFDGRLREFTVPLDLTAGTEFDRRVWAQVLAVGYGDTATYSDIAEAIGSPAAVRAVGTANGRNPVPVIVPCHRIVRRGGGLGGYGGGLDIKRALLALESAHSGLFV